MISYFDIAFLIIAGIMIFVNASRGLVVSLLGMLRFVLIVPLSYYLSGYAESYITDEVIGDMPLQVKKIVAFVVCFLILLVLSWIVMLVLKILQKKKGMPLRHTNAFLGGVFGLIKALALVIVISVILGNAVEFIPKTNQLYEPIKSSYAVEFVSGINFFDFI